MELIEAVTRGDFSQVKELLAPLPDDFIREDLMSVLKNRNGETLLMIASIKGYPEIVELLLEKGADPRVNNLNRPGYTPLHYATAYNHLEVVKLLLDPAKGNVDPSIKTSTLNITDDEYQLFLGDMTERLRQLAFGGLDVETGAPMAYQGFDFIENSNGSPNWTDTAFVYGITRANDKGGMTSLHIAARLGRSEILKELLSAGINPNITDDNGDTPLYHALVDGHIDIFIDLLNNGADISAGRDGANPLTFFNSNLAFVPMIKVREEFKRHFPSFQALAKKSIVYNNIKISKLPRALKVI